jgi:hypothetical protein
MSDKNGKTNEKENPAEAGRTEETSAESEGEGYVAMIQSSPDGELLVDMVGYSREQVEEVANRILDGDYYSRKTSREELMEDDEEEGEEEVDVQ